MAKVTAPLRVLDLKNEKVHTRWGYVQFDKDGLATVEVEEEELDLLRQTKPFPWLDEGAEQRAAYDKADKATKAAEEKAAADAAAADAKKAAAIKADEEKMQAHRDKPPEKKEEESDDSSEGGSKKKGAKK